LLLNDTITRYTEYNGLVLGIVLLCVVLGLREGLLDVAVRQLERWRLRPAAAKREIPL
jgi:branched-chain amino acid transport system permease protein